MQALGYSLTWRTYCFLDGGCGETGLFGHTNGDGDFVLFDALGWPWPVHECYARRFGLCDDSDVVQVRGSRSVGFNGRPNRPWERVRPLLADPQKHRAGLSIIGTVTNIEKTFIGSSDQFRDLSNNQKKSIEKTLGSSRSFIVVVDGDGYEYGVFADLKRSPARFRDTVAIKLKPVRLLNQDVFVARQLKVFRFDGH